MTTAETIAAQHEGDVRCDMDMICREAGATVGYDSEDGQVYDSTQGKYRFADGSAIIIGPWGWDLALNPASDACFCCVGEGRHSDGCPCAN